MVDLPWRLVCLDRPREQSTRGSLPSPSSVVPGTPVWVELLRVPSGAVEVDVGQVDDEVGLICAAVRTEYVGLG